AMSDHHHIRARLTKLDCELNFDKMECRLQMDLALDHVVRLSALPRFLVDHVTFHANINGSDCDGNTVSAYKVVGNIAFVEEMSITNSRSVEAKFEVNDSFLHSPDGEWIDIAITSVSSALMLSVFDHVQTSRWSTLHCLSSLFPHLNLTAKD